MPGVMQRCAVQIHRYFTVSVCTTEWWVSVSRHRSRPLQWCRLSERCVQSWPWSLSSQRIPWVRCWCFIDLNKSVRMNEIWMCFLPFLANISEARGGMRLGRLFTFTVCTVSLSMLRHCKLDETNAIAPIRNSISTFPDASGRKNWPRLVKPRKIGY